MRGYWFLIGFFWAHLVPSHGRTFYLRIETANELYAGCDSMVVLDIYFVNGMVTEALWGEFEAGSVDVWERDYSLGDPYQIEIEKDGSGTFEEWKLWKIVLEDTVDGRVFTFVCDCWVHWYDDPIWVYTDSPACYYIEQCRPGSRECGWSDYSSSLCTSCYDPYYSDGWGGGCPLCPDIVHCLDRTCTTSSDTTCHECENNGVVYKISYDGRQCVKICGYDNYDCWPGVCADDYSSQCTCTDYFYAQVSGSQTVCQLSSTKSPTIETCRTSIRGGNGELKSSESTGPTTHCQYQNDVYGKFQPVSFTYDVTTTFIVDTSLFPTQPWFVDQYDFGVTDVSLDVVKVSVTGAETDLSIQRLMQNGRISTFGQSGDIGAPTVTLSDGESMCIRFSAFGGGFVTASGPWGGTTTREYEKTSNSELVCYRFDGSPPRHCLETKSCSTTLLFETRVSRTTNVHVDLRGWEDVIPPGGTAEHASGIEHYEVSIHEVHGGGGQLQVGLESVFNQIADHTTSDISIDISPEEPRLYCVMLEVKDYADNVKQARRFFLYDDSTAIMTNPEKRFYVSSAMPVTEFQWQRPGETICLDWEDYFYNRFYLDNNLLDPIEPDQHGLINGVYEQTSGTLPVSGTANVAGIIKFMFSFSRNAGQYSAETEVPNFLDQHFCSDIDTSDGDTLALRIQAIDIAGHSYAHERQLFIDGSPPVVEITGLVKDGYRQLSAHDHLDLSKMKLEFNAFDPHSGTKTVEWSFGIIDYSDVVDSGTIAVFRVNKTICPDTEYCYCPLIGECEVSRYTISLNGLFEIWKHIGNHNRNYFFTVTITNTAEMVSTDQMIILVDDSPPETGVVSEGPDGYQDIDYTSSDTFEVNIHGFIDHESGIKSYRVGLADRCLSVQELYQMNGSLVGVTFAEVDFPDNSITLPANFTGKQYVTGIALNNAMDPSDAVCSDGISKDTTPPILHDVMLEHARWSESISCHGDSVWYLRSDLVKLHLDNTKSCYKACESEKVFDLLEAIPLLDIPLEKIKELKSHGAASGENTDAGNSTVLSNYLCTVRPRYDSNVGVFLPNDHIILQWKVQDEISQIEDFYVGFGTDESETQAPGIVNYIPTNRKQSFSINHAGIGTDEEFFIFLKAVNKAGLDTILPIGPVIIDETPPRNNSLPTPIIDGDDIVVGWDSGAFYDDEQTTLITRISYEICHDNVTVTSLLDWRLHEAAPCSAFTGGCLRYPLSLLQKQDTDLGLAFYFNLYIFNIAGHFTRVRTPEFTIPSIYPPTLAVIIDLDPEEIGDHAEDIDAHFSVSTVCARWYGFHHHEDLTIEFGVGTLKGLDDIVNFRQINFTNSFCLVSSAIPDSLHIFVSLRATSSGGSTISSSDGITIYNSSLVLEKLTVYDGQECFIPSHLVAALKQSNGDTFDFAEPLSIGKTYTLRIHGDNLPEKGILLQSPEIHTMNVITGQNKHHFIFTSFTEYPKFAVSGTFSGNISVELFDCEDDLFAIPVNNSIVAHWRGISDHFTFEAAVVKLKCSDAFDTNCIDYQTSFTSTGRNSSSENKVSSLQINESYYVAVKPCLNSVCLKEKLSTGVITEPESSNIEIVQSVVELTTSLNCSRIQIEWNKLSFINVPVYQWSVTTGVGSKTDRITQWKTTQEIDSLADRFQVDECVYLPVHAFKEQFACVRVFTSAELMHQNCRKIIYSSHQNAYTSTVYEIDASSDAWKEIKQATSSRYLGDKLRLLHGNDVDFGTEHTDLIGVVLNGNNREITWYLMTSRQLPSFCEFTPECKASKKTNNGYVRFPRSKIGYNTIYFICAWAPESQLLTDTQVDRYPVIQTCSNGFVLDDRPPTPGIVLVKNLNGYINGLQDILNTWEGFDDNVDARSLGYASKIKSYKVEIGSKPYSGNIRRTEVYDRTSLVLQDLIVSPGTTLYITVTAEDHAGLKTSVSTDEFMVDSTPPTAGKIELSTLAVSNWVKDSIFDVTLSGFTDSESTIDKYIVFLGSSRFRADVIPEREYDNNIVEINLEDTSVLDGHTYFLGAKARNKAGLASEYVFLAFRIDRSPPTAGYVLDGVLQNTPDTTMFHIFMDKDIDYQTDVSCISGHWKHFTDPHSGISYYKVGLGTQPNSYDVEPSIDVGLRTDISWKSNFIQGQKFYITVEACNMAGLCKALSSDSVVLDNSPPIPGRVHVGSSGDHQTYVPRNTNVAIFWTGFEDPHSGMDHYEVCLGAEPGSCDIVPQFSTLLSTNHILPRLYLPLNTRLYATVFGYNKNKQSSIATSNYFIVDVSPPVIQEIPTFVTHPSWPEQIAEHWEKSLINLKWKFVDDESNIARHLLTLATHHEGHTPVENVELEYNVNQITINLNDTNWLHNGDTYRAIVTACNEAGLCITAESDDLLIDSTPPHMGGLLSDQGWQNFVDGDNAPAYNINISWYGFHDQESGIRLFYIGIGRTFSENDLSGGLVKFYVNETMKEYSTEIKFNSQLKNGDKIIVSVIAENNAGLKSAIARATYFALSSSKSDDGFDTANGMLEIETHSCEIHFCNKDCTCATVGSVCTEVQAASSCNAYLSAESNPLNISVSVFSGSAGHPQHITASSSCLSAHWVTEEGLSEIKRFEWTLGLLDQPYGEGVFDLLHEDPWIDVAHFQYATHCVASQKSLKHNSQYVIYVKAWLTMDAYVIFPSEPVLIDQTAPKIRKGRYVLDSDETCVDDIEFTDLAVQIFACWGGVFYEAQGEIVSYVVSMGTKPGADNIIPQTDVGLNVTFHAFDAMLLHGHKYYFTVIAYNNVGLHKMSNSNGFVVDMEPPSTGVVYTTGEYENRAIQSNTDTFELSWQGFLDLDTGIKSYLVALYEISDVSVMVHNFTKVSGQTRLVLRGLNLTHNVLYQAVVKAVDAVGHMSEAVLTEKTLIDTTGPVTFTCDDKTVVLNASQKISRNKTVIFTANFKLNTQYTISGKVTLALKMPRIKFQIDQRIGETFSLQSTHDGDFEFHYSFFSDFDGPHDVRIETEDRRPLQIEVQLRECVPLLFENSFDVIRLTQVSAHLLKASLNVMDPESKLKKAWIGLGTTPNGYQLMAPFKVDISKDAFIPLTTAKHGTPLYATVVVENFASLQSMFSSTRFILDHTPPIIFDIGVKETVELLTHHEHPPKKLTDFNDTEPSSMPRSARNTEDERIQVKLNISWQAKDQESGIELCLVSVGTYEYRDDVMTTNTVFNRSSFLSDYLNIVDGTTLYTTLKCVNAIGLATVKVSRPIFISLQPPRISESGVTIVPFTAYSHGELEVAIQTNQSTMQFTWDSLTDEKGISGYEYRISSSANTLTDWTFTGKKNFVTLHGLKLDDSHWYTAEVRAVNEYGVLSNDIDSKLLVDNSEPTLTGQGMVVGRNGTSLYLNWEHVFGLSDDIPTLFDVTIGSGVGYSDLFDAAGLASYSCSFETKDTSILTGHVQEIHITLWSVYATGRREFFGIMYNIAHLYL